jgi:hypothetical protein
MEKTPLIFEDRLDATSKFLCWKERVTLALKEYDLWELVEKLVVPSTDPAVLEVHWKKEIKPKQVLLDSVKDHIIPQLYEK